MKILNPYHGPLPLPGGTPEEPRRNPGGGWPGEASFNKKGGERTLPIFIDRSPVTGVSGRFHGQTVGSCSLNFIWLHQPAAPKSAEWL